MDKDGVADFTLRDSSRDITITYTAEIGTHLTEVWFFGGRNHAVQGVLNGIWIDDLTITVTEPAPEEAQLSVEPEDLSIHHGGANTTLMISANVPWVAATNDPWITFPSGISGSGDGPLSISVAPNHLVGQPRHGHVEIQAPEHGISKTVEFYQPPDIIPVEFSMGGLRQVYDGFPKSVLVTSEPEGVPYRITYEGASIIPVSPGYYHVEVISDSPWFTGSKTALFQITPPSLYAQSHLTYDLGNGYRYHIHLGWLWDDLYPFVYFWSLGWAYIIGSEESHYYLWDYTHTRMLYVGAEFYPYAQILLGENPGTWIVWPNPFAE